MKNDILLMGPLMTSVMTELEHDYTVHRYWESADKAALLQSIGPSLRVVVTDGGTGVNALVLEQLPQVELVSVYGVGVDAVALDYCKQHRIKVTNTPDVLSDDVADMGVALMLAISRNIVQGDNYCRSGRWSSEGAMPLTTRMSGKRAGILGMGSIGLRLARRLSAFDMQVSYCNRSKRTDANYRYFADLIDLAREVNYLIVAASASEATSNIIDERVLNALGPDGYLINISRGSLVDQPALIRALESGTIKGAGLDVFADEPNIPEALCRLDNVVLQPHHASGTQETRKAMGKVVCDNVAAYFDNQSLITEYFR